MFRISIILTYLLAILLISINIHGSTIYVPGDSSTIQSGINGAIDGDTVLVSPGVYTERIYFDGKAIVIKSIGGKDITYIQSSALGGAVVAFGFEEDSSSVLDGFTIDGRSMSLGIYCNYASPIIQNCEIRNCRNSTNGWGIILNYSYAKIRYNLIHDNNVGYSDGGIGITGQGIPEIFYNEIYNNTPNGGAGINCFGNTIAVNIYRNLIRDNASDDSLSAGIMLNGTHCKIVNNTISTEELNPITLM